MYSAELNVPQNHVYLFKPHTRNFGVAPRKRGIYGIMMTSI